MRNYALLALGVAVCLTTAVLMAFGEGVLGGNHTDIAKVIEIVGIGLVTSSSELLKKQNHQQEAC